jgi:hypothetical protein
MNLFATNFPFKKLTLLLIITGLSFLSSEAQVIQVPSNNPPDSTSRLPLGCFYGYERTEALYTSTQVNMSGTITQVGFYVDALNGPALSTPVVIKMKTTTASTLSANNYSSESSGSTTVWSGNITSSMLSVGAWVTIILNAPFNYSTNNLLVFVETNYGTTGGENWNSKQFRQGDQGVNLCQYWEQDDSVPTDFGELTNFRPNVQLTFGTICTGVPNPGNTVSSMDSVCSGTLFTLSLQNISVGVGLTYQWQSSNDGINFNDIAGATNSTYTTSQTSVKYYHCIVTCTNSGQTATSTNLKVAMQLFYHCYCGSYATTTEDTKIDSVHLGTINTGTDSFQCESYTDYTGGPIPILSPGQPYNLHIVNGSCTQEAYEAYVAVYIDYNHNSSFTDNSELVYSYGPILTLNGIPDFTLFVPFTAQSGTTGMRVVLEEGADVPLSCGTYTRGETEDYLVNISSATACSGAPAPGATYSTLYAVCPNEPFTLSIQNYPVQTGITYQWQYSTDGVNWYSGGTTFTWVDSQTVAMYYRCRLTCNAGGIGYSNTIQIAMNPFYKCYCSSYATSVENDTKIDTVKFGTISAGSNPDHCESYTDNSSLTTNLTVGISTPIHIVNGSCDQQFYESYLAAYIDTDQSGLFDADELFYSYGPTTGLNSVPDANITVNGNGAKPGMTGMRIIIEEGDSIPKPCGTYLSGETEDYTVNIISGSTLCQDPPNPGTASADVSSICSAALPVNINLTVAGNDGGIGETYQWESSIDGTNWTPIAGQTSTTGTATLNAGAVTTYYRVQVHCGNTTLPSIMDSVVVLTTPVGDILSTAIVVNGFPYTDVNNNFSSNCWTSNYDSASAQPSPDVYYKVNTGGVVGSLQVSTCNTVNFNTYLHILDENGAHVHSNDNNGPLCSGNDASDVITTDANNQFYYVVVEGKGLAEGNYQLDLHFITAVNASTIPNESGEVSLFPNPNNGTFDLSLNLHQNVNDNAALNITNAIGQVIHEENAAIVNGKLMTAITLPATSTDGLYMLSVRVGDRLLNKLIVVQH